MNLLLAQRQLVWAAPTQVPSVSQWLSWGMVLPGWPRMGPPSSGRHALSIASRRAWARSHDMQVSERAHSGGAVRPLQAEAQRRCTVVFTAFHGQVRRPRRILTVEKWILLNQIPNKERKRVGAILQPPYQVWLIAGAFTFCRISG